MVALSLGLPTNLYVCLSVCLSVCMHVCRGGVAGEFKWQWMGELFELIIYIYYLGQ